MDTVKVGPLSYTIEDVDGLTDEDQEIFGCCFVSDCRMQLRGGLKPPVRAVTLWHEIMHAILVHAGFDDPYERIVGALSHGVVGVLQENPELLADLGVPEGVVIG